MQDRQATEQLKRRQRPQSKIRLNLQICARIIVLHEYTCPPMKSNITLKIDKALLKEVKILAAERGTSISAMLSGQLAKLVNNTRAYDLAKKRALTRLRKGMELHWTPPRSRDELHER